MPIQEQFNKLISQQIQMKMMVQQCFLLLKKQKKLLLNFHKEKFYECNSIEYKVQFNFYQYKMTQHNSLNVKLSNSQLNKLKSSIKNETDVVLRLSSNMIGDNEA